MEATHRIKIKIGDAEFEAEGPSELVKQQYSAFLEAVSKRPQATTPTHGTPKPSLTKDATSEELSLVFQQGKDGISLLRTPRTDNPKADALIVLLYGFQKLQDERYVGAPTLLKAAVASGLGLDRLDRTIEARSAWIHATGNRKGKRYTLTNPGIVEAKKMVDALINE